MTTRTDLSTSKIGILGGGQLAAMLTESAIKLGFTDITVLDPTPSCPAKIVGATQIVGAFTNPTLITELAKKVDILTYDIESVDIEALQSVQENTDYNCKIYPDPSCLYTIHDKYEQNRYFDSMSIPLPAYHLVTKIPSSWENEKFVVKTRTGGYDGKGVWVLNNRTELQTLIEKYDIPITNLFVEEFVEIDKEIAIISTLDPSKNVINYPIVETIQKDGICTTTYCPTPLTLIQRTTVNNIAKKIVTSFNTKGVFGIEFFLTKDGQILLNEVAPRVHNSGHYTIEATNCSQFEQHMRSILDLPLVHPQLLFTPVVMHNILASGDGKEHTIKHTNTNVHWYNKSTNDQKGHYKKNRKVGHYTNKLPLQKCPYPLVYIVMGSTSDLETLKPAIDLLSRFKIPHKVDVVSAHRTPEWMFEFGRNVESLCAKVIIAAAGGAAHLPGMLASITPLPVIGVPIPSKHLKGEDSLLSIVEMPDGVPVATVGIGKAKNAAILALKILGATAEVKTVMTENKEKVDRQRKTLSHMLT